MTYEDIAKNIKNGKFEPVYLLMGEEDYYIDRIADYIADNALDENEKEFNLTVVYGMDTDMASIVNNRLYWCSAISMVQWTRERKSWRK